MQVRSIYKFLFICGLFFALGPALTYAQEEVWNQPAFQELLKITGLPQTQSLADIVEQTQKHWLRPSNKERWEIEQDKFEAMRDEAMQQLDKLNYLEEIQPQSQQYDTAIILGALVGRVRTRLAYLVKLWNQGIRFQEIVLLGGGRPLDPTQESEQELYNDNAVLPLKQDWQKPKSPLRTEADMLRFVYENSELPDGMRQLPVTIVDTPMQRVNDQQSRRPSTQDTIEEWLRGINNPKGMQCLAISNQPYVGYQGAVLKGLLTPQNINVETVGHGANGHETMWVYLDSLARHLWQEQHIRN